MSDDALRQFYDTICAPEHDIHQSYMTLGEVAMGMDGLFTLEHLKIIVAAWEEYLEATKTAPQASDK